MRGLDEALADRQRDHVRPAPRLQPALERGNELLDGLFRVAHVAGDLAGAAALGHELDQAERARIEPAVVIVGLEVRSNVQPGRRCLDGCVQLRNRHRLPVHDTCYVVAFGHRSRTSGIIAADDDRARKAVTTRCLARDHRDICLLSERVARGGHSHLDARLLSEAPDEPESQDLVVFDDRYARLLRGSL